MHTLHETFWGRTNRVAGEEEGHRAAKSNGVMEGDGQRPLHTAMGAGEVCRRTGKPDGDCLGRRGPGWGAYCALLIEIHISQGIH